MEVNITLAKLEDLDEIITIIDQAILQRKKDGSEQWQNGYPNRQSILNDIERYQGYIITIANKLAGYCAIIVNEEPAYNRIDGNWLQDGDTYILHRMAISDEYRGKGFGARIFLKIEEFAISNKIYSIKLDTNFDNVAMLRLMEKLGYVYCGEVLLNNSPRKAFQKILLTNS